MSYTSGEEFLGKLHPDTDPLISQILCESDQERVRSTGKGSVDLRSLIPVPSKCGENGVTTSLESLSVSAMIADLFSPSAEIRLEAVRAIEAAGKGVCLEVVISLQEVLRDDASKVVRAAVAETLGILGEYAPVEILMDALSDDPYWDVRAAAAQSLGNLGKRIPIEYLGTVLDREDDESVREAIVRSLGKQGKAMPVDVLVKGLLGSSS